MIALFSFFPHFIFCFVSARCQFQRMMSVPLFAYIHDSHCFCSGRLSTLFAFICPMFARKNELNLRNGRRAGGNDYCDAMLSATVKNATECEQ